MANGTPFKVITNDDIYAKLVAIEDKLERHTTRIKINRWIATSALSLSTFIGGIILTIGFK